MNKIRVNPWIVVVPALHQVCRTVKKDITKVTHEKKGLMMMISHRACDMCTHVTRVHRLTGCP